MVNRSDIASKKQTDKIVRELQKDILKGYKYYQSGKIYPISEARDIAKSWH